MLTALFVTLRIVANPVSNVFQKRLTQRGTHPLVVVGATHALLTLVVLPFAAFASLPALGAAFWANMVAAALLAVSGNAVLVAALERSDLSVLGPVNAYKAVVGLLLAIVLVGEIPSATGLAGVLLIVAGSWFVVDRDPAGSRRNAFARFFAERGVQLRLGALVLSATEAVFLKRALLAGPPPAAFVAWSILGVPIAGAALALLPRRGPLGVAEGARASWRAFVWLAITTGLMQIATLFTFGRLQVGYSLALFQLSTLLSVGLGWHFFQEREIGRRLAGAVVMIAGALLIAWGG